MKILRITKQEISDAETKAFDDRGMRLVGVSPAFISAFTSMKIAKAIDKNYADIVEVSRLEDAIAAISARKLSEKQDYKIVYRVMPNSPVPLPIPNDILSSVDGWLFSSQRLMQEYPQQCKTPFVLQCLSFEDFGHDVKPICDEVVFSWIGDIVNTERLRQCLDAVERSGAFTLRVCGTGKAKDVMPLVRMARHMPNGNKVIWVGEEYRLLPEITACHAAIITDNDISAFETALARSGAWLIEPDEIDTVVENPSLYNPKTIISIDEYVVALRDYYEKHLTGVEN